jgi:hypothetical protein
MSQIELRLRDQLLDLDQPITVMANGQKVDEGRVARSLEAIERTLNERNDPQAAAAAILTVPVPSRATRHAPASCIP